MNDNTDNLYNKSLNLAYNHYIAQSQIIESNKDLLLSVSSKLSNFPRITMNECSLAIGQLLPTYKLTKSEVVADGTAYILDFVDKVYRPYFKNTEEEIKFDIEDRANLFYPSVYIHIKNNLISHVFSSILILHTEKGSCKIVKIGEKVIPIYETVCL